MKIKIDDHIIGKNYPPFIVAEAGINHNGEINNAFNMIVNAKKSGVDAIKFQTYKTEEFVDSTQSYSYISQGKEVTESMFEMFKRCEFSPDDWIRIKKKCDDEKIIFWSTPQNKTDLEFLLKLGIPAIKIGSDDLTNLPLLRDYSDTGLPLIISSGMADFSEIHTALETIGTIDGYPTVLLVTTSQYPTPPEDVNLKKFTTLSSSYPDIPLGFSDHTQGNLASSLAVVFGSCFFEKHFTLDHNMPGPDHWFSMDISELKNWVESIHTASKMMGENSIKPTLKELEMRKIARRSITAISDIKKGDNFNYENLGMRRPGTGLPASMMDKIINLIASRNIKNGELIKSGDFE